MAKLRGLFDHEDSSGMERKAGRTYDEPDESIVLMRLRSGVCVRIHEIPLVPTALPAETKTLATTGEPPVEVKVLPDPDIGITKEAHRGRS